MKKKTLLLCALSCMLFWGCKKESLPGKNSLVDVFPEPKGANCAAGGLKVNTGLDDNRNNVLDSNEVQNTQYICNGNDGGYDKLVTLYFPANGYGYTSNTVEGYIAPIQNLYNFDISNYVNADSIAFTVYLKVELQTANPNASCIVDLYDVTNNKVINNTTLASNLISISTNYELKSTTVNFMKDLPKSPITLNVRIKSSHEGSLAVYYLPMLTIFRKK